MHPKDTDTGAQEPRGHIRQCRECTKQASSFSSPTLCAKPCPLYKQFNYMSQKQHTAVLNCPGSFPEPASWQPWRRGEAALRALDSTPVAACSHPFCPCSAISEQSSQLTADIYLAYLISSAGFAFYSQLRPRPPPLPAASPQP